MFTPLPIDKNKPDNEATTQDGVELCKLIYTELSTFGFYPALTGGLLYKNGKRKDIDIVLYRNRQDLSSFTADYFEYKLSQIGIEVLASYGFVTKAKWKGFSVDIFNPESTNDESEYGEKND